MSEKPNSNSDVMQNLWLSYYGRPKSFIHGGVNQSRLERSIELVEHANYEVWILNPENGFSYLDNELPQGVKQRRVFHFGKHRMTMCPIGLYFLKIPKNRKVFLELHEGWTLSNHFAYIWARTKGIKVIITPHGVYDPNILAHLKLLRIRRHFEISLLEAVSAVHVFTKMEENQVKLLAKKSNIIQSPTGYNLPEQIMLWQGGGGYIFFNGRFDINHKGIDLLLTAFQKSKVNRDLLLVGPDFLGDLARVRSLVLQLGIGDRVYIVSPQSKAVIEYLGIHCDLYVHPSRWEAFGRSTFEMMALGVPTMISSTENIASIDGFENCCYVIEPSSLEIEKFISTFFSDEQKNDLKKNGREWIKNNLNWKNIIEKYTEDLSNLR